MAEQRITERTIGEREAIRQVGVDTYRVESFENPGKFYDTNLRTETCTCPASEFGYGCQKHLVLADAVASVPAGPGASVIIARLVELVRSIYKKNPDIGESYATLIAVTHYRYSTESMRLAVNKKHGVRLARAA